MIQSYHGATAQEHEAHVHALCPKGYRMVSLSVYGTPDHAHYAAVWAQRPGAEWAEVHGLHAEAFQATVDAWAERGWGPVMVSATGSGEQAVFTAVFEQGLGSGWIAAHGMPSGTEDEVGSFQWMHARATATHLVLRSMTRYGAPHGAACFAAVWHPRSGFIDWHDPSRLPH